jgi:hypothetical protein
MASSSSNDHDRALGVLHDPLTDRTEDCAGDAAAAARSDHDHVRCL